MQVKIKKLHPDAVIPTYAKSGDGCLDLTAIESGVYKTFAEAKGALPSTTRYIEYRTGLSFEIPAGYVGLVFPRSSISNTELSLSNSVGVVDSGYRGEVRLRFRYHNTCPIQYSKGDRIGQILIIPYPRIEFVESDALSDSERGKDGFGSTGGTA